jgi:hypothetical protein
MDLNFKNYRINFQSKAKVPISENLIKSKMGGKRLFWSGLGFFLLVNVFPVVQADNWRGSIRSKLQTDNRYDRDGDYTAEAWGDFIYDNTDYDVTGRFAGLSRFSTDIYNNKFEFYQAYLEKKFAVIPLTLRGGRFEKSDSLGLYLVDGASGIYQLTNQPLSLEVYAGRPVRIDHVRSVSGNWVAGFESNLKTKPWIKFAGDSFFLDAADYRFGMQALQRDYDDALDGVITRQFINQNFDVVEEQQPASNGETTYRLNASSRLAGYILSNDKPFEMLVQGSYAMDKNRFENVLLESWWDPLKNIRLRNYFEAYRPKDPFVTFRDRFYAAYALGQQEVWRGSVEHRYSDKTRYSVGLQYANRDEGYNGYGVQSAISHTLLPGFNLNGQFDYLELGDGENATSVYVSGAKAVNEKLRVGLNAAWRLEDKLLYGENMATGVETEVQYMLQNSIILKLTGSYINNTNINNEYLGALQLTYYYDRFKPTAP